MTSIQDPVIEPIPISSIAGRYLLFDINVVTYLRKAHNICGVLIGSLPQVPQQNIFLGLPVELLLEEVMYLVRKNVAYIVDDFAWHKGKFSTLEGVDRKLYFDLLKAEGRKARIVAEGNSRKRAKRGLANQAAARASKESASSDTRIEVCNTSGTPALDSEANLFRGQRLSPTSPPKASVSAVYTVTTTTSYSPFSLPQHSSTQLGLPVPASYPLFAHLHALNYFVTPGLRFGCDYTVYPGDPLRFHSHFLAVGYDWDADILLLDIVGGGRLGTGVKKGFLIGGENHTGLPEGGNVVRTFCIEWSGM